MLISAAQPSKRNCFRIAPLKKRMEVSDTNRLRYTSTASASSTFTNVSEDSQRQPISPTYFDQSFDRMSKIPVCKNILANGHSCLTNAYNCMSLYSGSIPNDRQQSFTFDGCKTNKPTSGVSQRQCGTVMAEQRDSQTFPNRSHTTACHADTSEQVNADETVRKLLLNPYTPSGSHLRTDDISSIECQCNKKFHQQQQLNDELGVRSINLSERLRGHVYDIPDHLPRWDTEECMTQGHTKHVVNLSRKGLNSSLLEIPTGVINDSDDTESGYIRTVKIKAGMHESLSFCVKRHAFTILVVINVLFLFVNSALLPYLLMRNSLGDKRTPNCFQCSDLSPSLLQDSIVDGNIAQDGDRCCFKTDDITTQDTDVKIVQVDRQLDFLKKMLGDFTQKKRSILYLQSNRTFEVEHGLDIRWSTSDITSYIIQGNLKPQYNSSRIQVTETGIFTIRLVVKFEHKIQPNQTEKQADLRCELIKFDANGGKTRNIDRFTKTVLFTKDTTNFVGNIHTIVRLKKDDAVGVSCPYDDEGKNFVSTVQGAYTISVIEES